MAAAGFGTYLVASGCTYGLGAVSFHSFSLWVSFDAVSISVTYRLAPWLLTVLSDLNKCFRLLTGFARCTTLGVCGRWWIRTTGVPDFKMSPCGGLLFFAFVLSANLPFQNQRTSLRAGNSQNAKNGFATLGVILKKFETLWSFRTL